MGNIYREPAKIPNIQWTDFPKDMPFEDWQNKAYALGMVHSDIHGKLLFDTAKSGPGEGYIVEIGTYNGVGAFYLAAGSKTVGREKVITIDVDRGHQYSIYSTQFYDRMPMQGFRSHLNWIMTGVQDWIIPIRCDSEEASKILDISVRMVHVDGGHSYEDCSSDIFCWGPKLISGGYMIFHDSEQEGVSKAVSRFVRDSSKFGAVQVLDVMTAYAIKL